jgi:voltage-gated potassium channel Kch
LIKEQPLLILELVAGLLFVKFVVLFAIGKITRLENSQNFTFAFALAQGGEFAFVLVSFAAQTNVLDQQVGNVLVATVALSMVVAPFLFTLNEKYVQPRFSSQISTRAEDEINEQGNPVILAGFGRFGHIIGRILIANGFKTTVLDLDADQVDLVRKLGLKVFYGDASRLELLRSAGAESAKLLVIAIDDEDKIRIIIEAAQKHFPHLRILTRATGRDHADDLLHMGIEHIYRETLGSSLDLTVDALRFLGVRGYDALRVTRLFRKYDEHTVRSMAKYSEEWDSNREKYLARARERIERLDKLFEAERVRVRHNESAWEPPAV